MILLQFILIYRVCVHTLQDWDYVVSREEGLCKTRTDGNDLILGLTSMKAAVWLGQNLRITRLHIVSPPPQEHFPLQSLFRLSELASATGRELALSWRERSGCADQIQVFS